MQATVQHSTCRVVKRLTVDDGPINDDADTDTRIKVEEIGLDYADHGSGVNVKAYLHGSVLDKDGTPNPKLRATHAVGNALAEGGWLRELIDEHTPPEFLPEHTLGRKP